MTVALLELSYAPLWRLHVGEYWGSFAEQLGEHHCFDVRPLLVAPSLLPGARERLDTAVQAHGLHCRNGWFEARPEQAAAVLFPAKVNLPPPGLLPLTVRH